MNNKLLYVIAILVVLMQLFAVLLPNWGKKNGTYLGLWQGCYEKDQDGIYVDICLDMDKLDKKSKGFPKSALQAARAFAIMAVIFSFLGIMCMMFCTPQYKQLIMVMFLASAICSLVAISVWSGKMFNLKGYHTSPATSWYLMLVTSLVCFCMGGYYLMDSGLLHQSSLVGMEFPSGTDSSMQFD